MIRWCTVLEIWCVTDGRTDELTDGKNDIQVGASPKNDEVWNKSPWLIFHIIFEGKYLSYSINWPNFIAWLPNFVRYWATCVLQLYCKSACDVMIFKVNLILLIQLFSLLDQVVVIKIQIFWKRKELLRWNKKHVLSFLKDFQSRK